MDFSLNTLPFRVRQEFAAARDFSDFIQEETFRCSLKGQNDAVTLGVGLFVDVYFTVNHRHNTISKLPGSYCVSMDQQHNTCNDTPSRG